MALVFAKEGRIFYCAEEYISAIRHPYMSCDTKRHTRCNSTPTLPHFSNIRIFGLSFVESVVFFEPPAWKNLLEKYAKLPLIHQNVLVCYLFKYCIPPPQPTASGRRTSGTIRTTVTNSTTLTTAHIITITAKGVTREAIQ